MNPIPTLLCLASTALFALANEPLSKNASSRSTLPTVGRTEFSASFAPSENWVKPSEQPWRRDLCLNGLWQFEPVALPPNFKEGQDAAPQLPAPTGHWAATPIRIPSPWNVNSFADKDGLGGDFRTYPSYPKEWESIKMGWLCKKFSVPADWKGRRIQFHFSAIAGDAEIVVNGKSAGRHFGIFLPFDLDATDYISPGQENELKVGVRKASLFDRKSEFGRRTYQAGSFWGQHIAGIWQDVHLVALPQVHISNVYIKPLLDTDTLEAEVTIANDTAEPANVQLDARAYPWLSKAGKDVLTAANPSSTLGEKAALGFPAVQVKLPARGAAKVIMRSPVKAKLQKWSPDHPNLYGLVIQTQCGGKILDSNYTRFGWRQASIKDGQFLLNGKPLVMKGDSWHFLGIPQMTRRYAWAWFTAMRKANLNAVRLHAQPYPPFYLDVADEMGILVLDETAIWASDGGPKLDSDAYWKDSENHVTELVMRDRNHPAIFGWSVSNEVMPIVRGVMRNPPGMKDKLVSHYASWAGICRKLDPTRDWVSADGEDDGEGRLPTYVVHYGGKDAMIRGAKSGKPWGVGEAGNAYYGTPEQVSEANGTRAYESFLGRMEGVAVSSYQSLVMQRENHASYRSVFNMVWYGLKPLPLGLRDLSRPPTLDDGIHFTAFKEGVPGVQPERLGPYCTTLNPGYTAALPLYETWPLFDAIRDASAEPPVPCKWTVTKRVVVSAPETPRVASVRVLSGPGGNLASGLKRTGVPLSKLEKEGTPELLFVDGIHPPSKESQAIIDQVLAAKGKVVVWGASPESLPALNALLPSPLELTSRTASSLVPVASSPIVAGLTSADLYYSELRPPEIMKVGLAGPLVSKSTVLLKACDTEWLLWNKQAEYAKTAMIRRSELQAKPSGAALISCNVEGGTLVVTTLPAAPRLAKQEKAVRTILSNLGLSLGAGSDAGKPIIKTGDIVRALMCGSFPVESVEKAAERTFVDPAQGDSIRASASVEGKPWKVVQSESGLFDFARLKVTGPTQNAVAYLSFWVSSPRNLDDLLIEPNIPVVGLEVAADDAVQAWVNGKAVVSKIRTGRIEGGKAHVEALKLHQGWNHFLIKVIQGGGGWQFTGRLTCNQPDFLAELESALEKP